MKLYDFEPGIFAGRLVKVSVNAYIFWQAASISILDIVVNNLLLSQLYSHGKILLMNIMIANSLEGVTITNTCKNQVYILLTKHKEVLRF